MRGERRCSPLFLSIVLLCAYKGLTLEFDKRNKSRRGVHRDMTATLP